MTLPQAVEGPTLVAPRSFRGPIGLRLARPWVWAPIVYLLTALPAVMSLSLLTPPFQAPDEPGHFQRAAGILGGGIVARLGPGPGQSGAILPRSVREVAEAFMYIAGRQDGKYSPDVMSDVRPIAWSRSDKGFADFNNIAIYPPFFYLPAVAALGVGRALDWGVLDSYRLARSFNGLVAVLIGTAAIGLATRGRSVLFAVLSLPMVLFLDASLSQDALMIPCMALAAALCSRAAERSEGRTWPGRLVAAVLIGAAVAGRPPNLFLTVALATPRPGRAGSSALWTIVGRGWPAALAIAIGLGWVVFGAAPAQVPMRPDAGVSIPGQVAQMLRHPSTFPSALLATLRQESVRDLKEAIGVLGWSDWALPRSYYLVAGAALIVAALLASGCREKHPRRVWGWAIMAGMVAAFVGVYGALYLSWTPVASAVVEGFQGRYTLPIATLAAVALPAITARRQTASTGAGSDVWPRSMGWWMLFAFAMVSDLWLPFAVFARYYV